MADLLTAEFWTKYGPLLLDGTIDTLVMTGISTVFAYLLGLPLGVALILTQPHGIRPNNIIYKVLGWIINVGRSLPFIILMVAIMDFTKLIVGTKIGVKGAIVPLVVSAAPFIVTILAYTAIAGAIGAGGLGDLAIRYGYQRRYPPMLLVTVIFLIVLVQLIQSVFSRVSNRIDKRLK